MNSAFNVSFVDGSAAAGDYATDAFNFSGQAIKSLQFGIGYTSTSNGGVLGLGYAAGEAGVKRAGLQPYANLPQKLVDEGIINTNAYSLWLNNLDASTGSILFGGVDRGKFRGTLQTLPIVQQQNAYTDFIIVLTGMGANGTNGSIFQNANVPVLLDSGSSLMYLPDNVVNMMYKTYNTQWDPTHRAAIVDCNIANQPGSLEFSFSGVTISVPMKELVIGVDYQKGQPICSLGIGPAGKSVAILGDTFLRSAYVVYDLTNNKISLAQTKFNSTTQDIQEIQSGSNGVPNATSVANAVSTAGPKINLPSMTGEQVSNAAAAPAVTANPWIGRAAIAGAGILMGFNGF